MSLQYFAIYRSDDDQLIYKTAVSKSLAKELSLESDSCYESIKSELRLNERRMQLTPESKWGFQRIPKNLYLLAYADRQYRDYVIYDFFKQVQQELDYIEHLDLEEPAFIQKKLRPIVKPLFDKFTEQNEASKLQKAIHKSEKVKVKIEENTHKMFERQPDIDLMQENADKFHDGAQEFYRNADEMNKQMLWENRKYWVYAGGGFATLGALAYFFFI